MYVMFTLVYLQIGAITKARFVGILENDAVLVFILIELEISIKANGMKINAMGLESTSGSVEIRTLENGKMD